MNSMDANKSEKKGMLKFKNLYRLNL